MSENNDLYGQMVKDGIMSQEDMDATLASEAAAAAAADTTDDVGAATDTDNNDGDAASDNNTGGDGTAAADSAAATTQTDVFYKSLGYEKDDDVVRDLNEYKAMQSRVNTLQEREAEIATKAQVLSKFENPYSHETIGKLDKAYEQLKIEDFSVLGKIISTTSESVANNPIEAIVVAKVLADPTILSNGITFADLMEIEESDRDGIDLTDKGSIGYKKLVMESNAALTKINTFQQSLSDVKGRYTFAHEEAQASVAKRDEMTKVLTPKVEELMKVGKQSFSIEGYEVAVTYTKEEISDIVSMATSIAVNNGIDVNTKEGVNSLMNIVQLTAKGAAVRSSNYEKALIASVYSKAKEDLLREQSLGKTQSRSTAAGSTSSKAKNESEALFDKMTK